MELAMDSQTNEERLRRKREQDSTRHAPETGDEKE